MSYLTEAFKSLDMLNEDTFDISADGIEKLKEFETDNETEEDTIDIIDMDLDDAEDTADVDANIGKVILQCNVCGSYCYEDREEIKLNEEETVANEDMACPYCHVSGDGFKIVGEVAEFKSDEESDEEVEQEIEAEPTEDADTDEVVEVEVEAAEEKSEQDESLKEDLEKVELVHDGEKITVETEPTEESTEKEETVVAPVSDETKEEIIDNQEPDEVDVEVDEIVEESFDTLCSNYLKEAYDNVKSYKTTKATNNDTQLKLEGIIEFNSGKTKKTNFIFESKSISKTGKVKFLGENAQITRGKKSFALTGSINNKSFLAESLTYNYRAGKPSKKVYGTVSNKKGK